MTLRPEEIEVRRLLTAAERCLREEPTKDISNYLQETEDRMRLITPSLRPEAVVLYQSKVDNLRELGRIARKKESPEVSQSLFQVLLLGTPRNAAHRQILQSKESEARASLFRYDSKASLATSDGEKQKQKPEPKGKAKEVETKISPAKKFIPEEAPKNVKKLSETTVKSLLQKQEDDREHLTSEMVVMAEGLKEIHRRTQVQLAEDAMRLEELDEALDANQAGTEARKKAVEELLETSWTNTWMYWTIILFASFSFFAMYLFMKVFPR